MDSEHEDDHHDDAQNGHGDSSAVSSLTGFLFGNIDEKGELDEDFLDDESKKHLGSLNVLGIGSLVKEIADDETASDDNENPDEDASTSLTPGEKATDAVDYSDINEFADEEEEDKSKIKLAMSSLQMVKHDDDDYDADDKILMPPPSWLPSSSKADNRKVEGGEGMQSTAPIVPLNTPLAAMLPPELRTVDVKTLFPEFRKDQVLRFSRLFKPVHVPHRWKKKKKKKGEGEKDGETKKEEQTPEKGIALTN